MNTEFRLLEDGIREGLWPLTLTRPVADIRMGILTVRERWERMAARGLAHESKGIPANLLPGAVAGLTRPPTDWAAVDHRVIDRPWQIPLHNAWAIRNDFQTVTEGRVGAAAPEWARLVNPGAVFIEPGAVLEHCILNATEGPIYIGREATVMDGAILRGPVAVCEGAVVKMGATVYGGTTIGPFCTVGGEVKNSVLMDHSNKAHHGYLGDSVVGRWCNLGAGTSNSNLRNSAGPVKVWNMHRSRFETAGIKCGLVMGDHSRTAIDTSLNTGTVVGVSANVFGGRGLTPKFIPSFSWGLEGEVYELEKSIRDICNWMAFKGLSLGEGERITIESLYHRNPETS